MNSLKSIWLLNANMVASFVDEIIHSRTHLAWMAPNVRWYTVKSFLSLLRNFGRLRLCIVRSILFVCKMTCSKCVPWRLLLGSDEDGARGASRRIYQRERRYYQLYRTSGIVFCGELSRSGLWSSYVSSVNWGRCIWRAEEFVSPWTSER